MNITLYKKITSIVFWFSIVMTIVHFVWCAVEDGQFGMESVLLNVLPYGLPIFAFSRARRWAQEEGRWGKGDVIPYCAFALVYLVMIVHVTLAGLIGKQSFINVYFNLPLIYLIPLACVGLIWVMVRLKPTKDASALQKLLYALPVFTLLGMVVHCGIVSAIELNRQSLLSSAPWWIMPLVVGLAYLTAALLLVCVYVVYRSAQKRKKN